MVRWDAGVSAELVNEVGVGVVAAGVAKSKADHVLLSSCDDGTGVSRCAGVKFAGHRWSLVWPRHTRHRC